MGIRNICTTKKRHRDDELNLFIKNPFRAALYYICARFLATVISNIQSPLRAQQQPVLRSQLGRRTTNKKKKKKSLLCDIRIQHAYYTRAILTLFLFLDHDGEERKSVFRI